MRLYYTDDYDLPLTHGHKFPIEKYRMTRDLLTRDGLFEFIPAPLAESQVIELVHDPEYVRQFLEGTLPASAIRRIGFPWSEGLVKRTLASVGGTLAATRDAISTVADGFPTQSSGDVRGSGRRFGGTLAGGTHHAFRAEGSGFCVFNDIAVAINWARTQAGIRKAAVIDLDVHQGDGTAAIFANDDAVLTTSVHGKNNFPFRKQQSRIDVELADDTEDDEYVRAVERLLPRVAAFSPDLVFYQSGVDALACDRLGRLSLTHAGLKTRDKLVLEFCRDHRVPVVITLGGGYGNPIEATAEAHANVFRTAAEVFALDK